MLRICADYLPGITQMLWVCRPSESLAEDLQELFEFPGGYADFCRQVERELRDLSGFVAERVRTTVKERGRGEGFLLRRNPPLLYLLLCHGCILLQAECSKSDQVNGQPLWIGV
jgi:hypothetical protein